MPSESRQSKASQLPELCVQFIATASNHHTQRARHTDLNNFVATMNKEDDDLEGGDFWNSLFIMPQDEATRLFFNYQVCLLEKGLSQSTVNRRLASIRAFLRFAQTRGVTHIESRCIIKTLSAPTIENVTFLDQDERLRLCAAPLQGNLRTTQGLRRLRDAALLSLLCEVPLQGGDVGVLRAADFRQKWLDLSEISSTEDVRVQLSTSTATSTNRYLERVLRRKRAHNAISLPLLGSFDRKGDSQGTGLVSKSVLEIVRAYGVEIGRTNLNSRLLRRTAIVRTLQDVGGDTKKAIHRFPHISRGTWEYYVSAL